MLEHALQQRQGKCRRLAGTRLGRAHDVFAAQYDGNGLGLDGRHGLIAHVGDGARQRFGQLQIGEGLGHFSLLLSH